MDITRLSLDSWRNLAPVAEIELPAQGLLVAAAPNATGKTNFLESIVMLLRGKSWRAQPADCVAWGRDAFIVRGKVARSSGSSEIAVRYHTPTRTLRIEEDGVPASPVTFYSHYPLVLFLADDTLLFVRSPAQRRNLINRVLVSSPSYVANLVQYQRVLRQRNAHLKQAAEFSDIAAWTELLVSHGTQLWQQREQLVDFWSTHVPDLYEQLTGETHQFDIALAIGVADTDAYYQQLERSFQHERRYGHTLAGPHRDDLEVSVNGRPVAAVFSQGQSRSLAVAFKLAAARYVEQTLKERPLILFDEVFSELDEERQERVAACLPESQVLITCTQVPPGLRQHERTHLLDLTTISQSPTTSTESTDVSAEEVAAEPASA